MHGEEIELAPNDAGSSSSTSVESQLVPEFAELAGSSQHTKVARPVVMPAESVVEEHRITGHAAFRAWCAHCVRGKGHCNHHMAGSSRPLPEFPKISFDYGFLGTRKDKVGKSRGDEGTTENS